MGWSEITTILLAISNIMFALFRWTDIIENRKARHIAIKARETQLEFNDRVTKLLENITPQG